MCLGRGKRPLAVLDYATRNGLMRQGGQLRSSTVQPHLLYCSLCGQLCVVLRMVGVAKQILRMLHTTVLYVAGEDLCSQNVLHFNLFPLLHDSDCSTIA